MLAKEVLKELPASIVKYFQTNGIKPNDPGHVKPPTYGGPQAQQMDLYYQAQRNELIS